MSTIPVASVIVPTYRRPEPLAACLRALAAQAFDRDKFEVIVVDDGSGAPPVALISSFQDRLSIRLVERANGGPGAARNTGVEHARGELLAFTDDDCCPEPDWLSTLVRTVQRSPGIAAGGRILNALQDNVFAEASQALGSYLYAYFARPGKQGRRFFTTNNLCLSARQFRELGGFDVENLADTAEDRDLCDRWRARGWSLCYVESAIVRHAHSMSLGGFWQQHFNYGQGAVYFHKAGGRDVSTARKLEPPTFYIGMLLFPFAHYSLPRAALIVALLWISQASYASGYFAERCRPRKRVNRRVRGPAATP